MHATQAAVGMPTGQTVLMWNPPWTLVLLCPILSLPFSTAALAWFAAQLALLVGMVAVVPGALRRDGIPVVVRGLIAVLFYPVIESLAWGQLGTLLAFFIALFLYFRAQGHLCAAGLALAPLTVKPHIFFLTIPLGCVWLSRLDARERRDFLIGTFVGVSLLVFGAMVLWPSSVQWWINGLMHPRLGPGGQRIESWETATIATLVRKQLGAATGDVPTWPMWGVPLASFVVIALCCITARSSLSVAKVAPLLLCVSAVAGSYGWSYDQAVLLIVQFWLLYGALELSRPAVRALGMLVIFSIQVTATVVSLVHGTSQFDFVWLPLAMGLLCVTNALCDTGNAEPDRGRCPNR